jgi:hypothetical protein
MYLGLGLRLGSGTFAGFDADAAAYFDRAGVTDATAKSQINAFVKGIKDLGLWSSIVSWPLRSSQNAGTGTTAYSLGGLATYNGTLLNSPTRVEDGITQLQKYHNLGHHQGVWDFTRHTIKCPSSSSP